MTLSALCSLTPSHSHYTTPKLSSICHIYLSASVLLMTSVCITAEGCIRTHTHTNIHKQALLHITPLLMTVYLYRGVSRKTRDDF